MQSYLGRPLSTKDIPTFNSLLLRMTISNGFSFSWVENEETKEFFKFITPGLVLPSRKKLSNSILKKATKQTKQQIISLASSDQIGVTLALDGWKNIRNQSLLGSTLILSSGSSLIWGAIDISNERTHTAEVIKHIEAIFRETQSKNILINNVVTDSAGEMAAARYYLY